MRGFSIYILNLSTSYLILVSLSGSLALHIIKIKLFPSMFLRKIEKKKNKKIDLVNKHPNTFLFVYLTERCYILQLKHHKKISYRYLKKKIFI